MSLSTLPLNRTARRMRFDGTLKSWNEERGLGLLVADQGGQDIVVRIEALMRAAPRPVVGQRFSFEVEPAAGGMKRASNVAAMPSLARQNARRRHHARQRTQFSGGHIGPRALIAMPLFALAWLFVAVEWHVPMWLFLAYTVLSVFTFVLYAADKSAAGAAARRTSEKALLLWGLAGGWPGALLAQQLLRHKTHKSSFQSLFWLTVAINIAALALYASPLGDGWPH